MGCLRRCLNHPLSGHDNRCDLRLLALSGAPCFVQLLLKLLRLTWYAEPCAHSKTRALPLFWCSADPTTSFQSPTASRRLFWEVIWWKGEPNTPLSARCSGSGAIRSRPLHCSTVEISLKDLTFGWPLELRAVPQGLFGRDLWNPMNAGSLGHLMRGRGGKLDVKTGQMSARSC